MRPRSLLAVASWSLLAVFGVQVLRRGHSFGVKGESRHEPHSDTCV